MLFGSHYRRIILHFCCLVCCDKDLIEEQVVCSYKENSPSCFARCVHQCVFVSQQNFICAAQNTSLRKHRIAVFVKIVSSSVRDGF